MHVPFQGSRARMLALNLLKLDIGRRNPVLHFGVVVHRLSSLK